MMSAFIRTGCSNYFETLFITEHVAKTKESSTGVASISVANNGASFN